MNIPVTEARFSIYTEVKTFPTVLLMMNLTSKNECMFGEDEAKEMLEKGPVFIELSDCGLTIDNKKPCIETDRDELDECQMLLYFPKQVDNITFEIILQFVFNRKMGK